MDAILDAAEEAVVEDGAAGLTIDAVACRAGVSKATVLYDFKSKRELIKAILDRRIQQDIDLTEAARHECCASSDVALRARIAITRDRKPDRLRGAANNLGAALAQHGDLHCYMSEKYRALFEQVMAEARDPRRTLVAFLALEGMRMLEWKGVLSFEPEEHGKILEEIEALLEPDAKSAGS